MFKNSLRLMSKVLVIAAVLFTAGVSAANEVEAENDAKCTWREVVVVVKSTRSVHYSEKDEGKVISRYMVKDCGDKIIVDPDTKTPVVPGIPKCPPNVQDCIRP